MTAIAIALALEEIIIAADSKVSWLGQNKELLECKIIQVREVFFLFAGYAGNKDKNFTVKDYGIEAIKKGRSLQEIADKFTNLIQILADILSEFLTDDPIGYAEQFKKQSELEVAFVGIEYEVPKVLSLEYKLEIKADYTGYYLKPNLIEYTPRNSRVEFIQLGYKPTGKIDYENKDSIRVIDKIIQSAIEECSLVGGPISILRITAKKTEWIRKGCC